MQKRVSFEEFVATTSFKNPEDSAMEGGRKDEVIMEVPQGFVVQAKGWYFVMPKTCLVSSKDGVKLWPTEHDYYFPVPCPHVNLPHGNLNECDAYYRVWGAEHMLPPAIAKAGGGGLIFGEWKQIWINGDEHMAFYVTEEPNDGKDVMLFCAYPTEDANPSEQPGLLSSDFAITDLSEGYTAIYHLDDSWRMLRQCCQRQYERDVEAFA